MKSLFLLVVAVFCAVNAGTNSTDLSTLRLVQVLYRHGARAPSNAYPADQYQEDHWIQGWKELTTLGMLETYELGQYLRTRYDGFLNSTYLIKELNVLSTDKDRTLQSAYCVLAGLYPPVGQQVWNTNIPWQPIAVHTVPAENDWVLYIDECPKLDKMEDEYLETDPGYKQVEADNQDLIDYVTSYTEEKPTLDGLFETINTFNLEYKHALEQPAWIRVNDTFERYMALAHYKSRIEFILPEMSRLKGGPLLGHMIKLMKEKIETEDITEKMFQYSAHSGNLNALLRVTRTHNELKPPLSSCIMMELHEDPPTQYSVRIFFRNETYPGDNEYELTVEGCELPCPLETFTDLVKGSIPDDPKAECQLDKSKPDDNEREGFKGSDDTGPGRTVFIVVVAILGCLLILVTLILGYTCSKLRKTGGTRKAAD